MAGYRVKYVLATKLVNELVAARERLRRRPDNGWKGSGHRNRRSPALVAIHLV